MTQNSPARIFGKSLYCNNSFRRAGCSVAIPPEFAAKGKARPLPQRPPGAISHDMTHQVHIIGGGLAGSEAAWQLAEAGFTVKLSEMRGAPVD